MTSGVLASLITGGTALVAAIMAATAAYRASVRASKANRDLLRLTSKLEGERDAEAALRDYQYEARKRLYNECQPLMFQAILLAEDATYRIHSLAAAARRGDLRANGDGWLDPLRLGYYFKSTAYFLTVPMTTARLLQRRLTVVDLGLDPELQRQYELLKVIYFSFAADFDIAPPGSYDPDRADPGEPGREGLLANDPGRYARQGMYRGDLEDVADALIRDQNGKSRPKTFAEFQAEWDQEGSPVWGIRETLVNLISGFHPARKPVLWRLLLVQRLLYAALVRADEGVAEGELTEDDEAQLLWYEGEPPPGERLRETLQAARDYVLPKMRDIRERVRARAASPSQLSEEINNQA